MTLSECIKNWKQSNYSIARPSCLKQCSKLSLETDQLFHLSQSTFWIQQKFRKKYKTITGEKYYSAKNLTLLTITRKVESKWIRRMFGTARSFKASLPLDIPEWHALRKYFLVRAYPINIVLLCIRMWIKFSVSHFAVIATETIVVPTGHLVGCGQHCTESHSMMFSDAIVDISFLRRSLVFRQSCSEVSANLCNWIKMMYEACVFLKF